MYKDCRVLSQWTLEQITASLERMQKVAQDFAQQHQADQKLAAKDREGYTLLLAMRSWEFETFAALGRSG